MTKDLIVILALAIPVGIILWSFALIFLTFTFEFIINVIKG